MLPSSKSVNYSGTGVAKPGSDRQSRSAFRAEGVAVACHPAVGDWMTKRSVVDITPLIPEKMQHGQNSRRLPLRRCPLRSVRKAIQGRPVPLPRLPQASRRTLPCFRDISGTRGAHRGGDAQLYAGRFFCPRCGSSVFSRSADEIEVNLGSLDTSSQLTPTYELWIIRRESWLPPFPQMKQYDRDREGRTEE